jgi:CheY-like chemotaxis protein
MAMTDAESTASPDPLILCVDDEYVGLEVRRILLQIFEREPVAAVVLDYAMPGLTGAEVATRMRLLKPEIPILMLSAYTSLPQEVKQLVDLSMTKGEGAPALLKNLGSLLQQIAS